MWRRARDDRLARIEVLSEEFDRQRDIAAVRLSSTITKASLLLVGAGLIAGSWAVDLIGKPFGVLPLITMVLAFAAAAAALISLIPRSTVKLEPSKLIDKVLFECQDPEIVDLKERILETKSAVIDDLNRDNGRRDVWVRIGYALLGFALLGGAASLITAFVTR
ncbi:hypothetical protein ASC66_06715 [Leifsonia sp. Root4]|uniref:hypothetical protein n=1 Tax=Leifsonia sp. Root4 TaxID=1736525 RepID=UPI0006FE4CC3|nr:hypothetical protein [Leifsonia sp. Root4]KQW06216.1 hypothetical protein ASC66_06715 [Leifsonia sp. Root4]